VTMTIKSGGDNDELESSLQELMNTNTLKWIFVGGKGGVGKTTTSCSVAIQLSKIRDSVLILSTDPAHNLSDALQQKFGKNPTPVKGFNNLFAMEIDASFSESVGFRLDDDQLQGWSNLLPELISAFPGIDEALSFAELMQSVQSMNYSVIVFDTAPTGHTMRLLSFPDLLEKALKKISSIKDKMSGALQMVNMMAGEKLNEEDIHTRLDNLRAVTTSVRQTFQDASLATFVCVCIPEFLSVYETERLVQELFKQGIDCSNIVVNQVLFPICGTEPSKEELSLAYSSSPINDGPSLLVEENIKLRSALKNTTERMVLFEESHITRRKMQSKYLAQIKDLYCTDFHVVCMALQPTEIRGSDKLDDFAKELLTPKPIPIVEESWM